MNDAELDARFRALGFPEPPPALAARTLAAVEVERGLESTRLAVGQPPAPPPLAARRPRWPLAVLGVGLAAGLLFALPSPAPVGSPSELVPRGVGEAVATLDLRVAVRSAAGSTERLAAGVGYHPGDTLLFRVSTSAPMEVRLEREGVPLWAGPLPAGETDLPVGYTLDAGDTRASFVVRAGDVASAPVIVEVAR